MQTPMVPSSRCYLLTKTNEACRTAAYQDSGGVWTIAYGRTTGVHEGMTCTLEEADAWLVQDMSFAAAAVNRLVAVDLTQDQFDALCDFTYNEGVTHLEESSLLRLLNGGDPTAAADQLLRWVYDGAHILPGLVKRRVAERDLWLYGVESAERLASM